MSVWLLWYNKVRNWQPHLSFQLLSAWRWKRMVNKLLTVINISFWVTKKNKSCLNNIRLSKWWQLFCFWLNYHIKCFSHDFIRALFNLSTCIMQMVANGNLMLVFVMSFNSAKIVQKLSWIGQELRKSKFPSTFEVQLVLM